MHRNLAVGLLLIAMAGACANGTDQTTSPPMSEPSEPAVTTAAETTSTTVPEPSQLIVVSRKSLAVVPGGPVLTAGLEATLGRVFDDYAGGIVFAQLAGRHELRHLRAGRQESELLHSEPSSSVFEFLDLVAPPGQPPTALLRVDGSLLLLPITGGAPEEITLDALAATGTGGEFRTASLGGNELMVAWSDEDGCLTVDLFTLEGDSSSVGLFKACGDAYPTMSDEGDMVVTFEVGPSISVVLRSTSDGEERGRWQVPDYDGTSFHVTGGRIAYASARGVSLVAYDGTWEEYSSTTGTRAGSVSSTRSPLSFSDLATLGGFGALRGCSSSTHPSLAPQDGLTEAAATTRDAIANAAIDCDLARVGSLLGPAVISDPIPAWWEAENDGFPALLELVNLLETPFAAVQDVDGTLVFTWPAVAVEPGDDADWEALRSLYNEEDIDRWKSGSDPYDRLVIRISEDGEWLQASNDF